MGVVITANLSVGGVLQALSNSMISLIFWRGFAGLFAGSVILVQAYDYKKELKV